MSDPIRDVVGEEARAALLQFMGQELPALHSIDKQITSRSASLQGLTLNLNKVLNSAAQPQQYIAPQPQQPVIPLTITAAQPAVSAPKAPSDQPEQLLLNFDYDVAKDIANKLSSIDDRLVKIEKALKDLSDLIQTRSLSDSKKKLDTKQSKL